MASGEWSAAEISLLFSLVHRGLNDGEIAIELDRTRQAVGKRRQMLQLAAGNDARRENEQDWQPLPGMMKRRCERCWYWFATPAQAQRGLCPECRREER